MTEFQFNKPGFDVFLYPPFERLVNTRADTLGDVKARHGIAMATLAAHTIAAALGPADDGKPTYPLCSLNCVEPRTHFSCGEVDIFLGPAPRPDVLFAIKLRRAIQSARVSSRNRGF